MKFNRLKAQKILIGLIIFASLMSIITDKMGWGAIYPCFHWKLFSQPLGTHHIVEQYRIYSKKKNEVVYHRNALQELNGFSTDDYGYTFNYFVEMSLKDSMGKAMFKSRLLSFVKYVVPEKESYKIIKEYYDPILLVNDCKRYDTITVINF